MVVADSQPVPVNVYETTGALVIVAPLPGVMGDDVSIELEPGRVAIRAAMRTPAEKDYLIHEWHYGPFERVVEIPEDFGADVKATLGNGQLVVSLGRGARASAGPVTVQPA